MTSLPCELLATVTGGKSTTLPAEEAIQSPSSLQEYFGFRNSPRAFLPTTPPAGDQS